MSGDRRCHSDRSALPPSPRLGRMLAGGRGALGRALTPASSSQLRVPTPRCALSSSPSYLSNSLAQPPHHASGATSTSSCTALLSRLRLQVGFTAKPPARRLAAEVPPRACWRSCLAVWLAREFLLRFSQEALNGLRILGEDFGLGIAGWPEVGTVKWRSNRLCRASDQRKLCLSSFSNDGINIDGRAFA